MEWFRFYHEVVNDPKVQRLPDRLFKQWVNLLCLASSNDDRGTLPSLANLAFSLRMSEAKCAGVLRDLEGAGLIDRDGETLRMHGWNSRQKRSDNVAERVAKYRSGNAPVTLQETLPHVRVTETDTETDTEQNRDIPPKSPKGERARQIKTPVPDDLDIPIDEWQRMGREQRMSDADLRRETESMKDHFRAKGERRADWVATWRNWMRSPYRKSTPVSEADRIYQAFVNGAGEPPRMDTR